METKESDEILYPLSQAAKRFLPKRNGRTASPTTLWRWSKKGLRMPDGTRIKLQVWHCGGSIYTTATACREFIESQTKARQSAKEPNWPRRDDAGTRSEETARKLRDSGLL